jgi:hypothetical protein
MGMMVADLLGKSSARMGNVVHCNAAGGSALTQRGGGPQEQIEEKDPEY